MSKRKPPASSSQQLIPVEAIERRIFLVRGQNVMLDSDLAKLYGVATKVINQAVKRNIRRFPEDFMFRLTKQEAEELLRSQIVTSNKGRGGRRYAPLVFTEQGVAMLSSVLNNERAIQVNTAIMRVFVRLRELLVTHKDLSQKLAVLEKKYEQHDVQIKAVFTAIKKLLKPPPIPQKRRIGFVTEEK